MADSSYTNMTVQPMSHWQSNTKSNIIDLKDMVFSRLLKWFCSVTHCIYWDSQEYSQLKFCLSARTAMWSMQRFWHIYDVTHKLFVDSIILWITFSLVSVQTLMWSTRAFYRNWWVDHMNCKSSNSSYDVTKMMSTSHGDGCLYHDVVTLHGDGCLQI